MRFIIIRHSNEKSMFDTIPYDSYDFISDGPWYTSL